MLSRRILAAVAVLCWLIAPAHAQKTKLQITTEIPVLCPIGGVGTCTATNAQQLWSDLVNSIMPTAPVVGGNLACFSGTTGLLQDCGVSPTSISITNIAGLGTGIATALGVNVGTAGSPVINGGALGTPSSGVATNLNGTASGLTAGTVTTNANLTGPVTSVGNATTIGANQVSRANEAQGVARSVIGVTGNATANVADIQGAAGQILAVNAAGTSLAFVGPGQTPGEPSTGSATAGNAGEYLVQTLAIGSPTALTTGINANVGVPTFTLTAGDWDVTGFIGFTGGTTTTVGFLIGSISATSATPDTSPDRNSNIFYNNATTFNNVNPILIAGPSRFSVSTNTQIFLVARANFGTSTASAFGTIRARRVR